MEDYFITLTACRNCDIVNSLKMSMQNTNRSWLIGVVLVAAIILGAVWYRTASPNTIKIGFVGPLTGGQAFWGEGARNMTMLAAEDINKAGGINGKKVEIVYEDGKCEAPTAIAAFQKLKASGVQILLGGHCSPETAGMVPLTKDGSVFMLAGFSSNDGAVAASDFAYRTSPDTFDMSARMVPFTVGRYKKIATISEITPFAKGYTTDFEAALKKSGVEIVAHEEFAPGSTDFRTAVTRLGASGADAIFVSPQSPITAVGVMKQIAELGIKVPVFGNTLFVSQDVFDKSGKPANMLGAFTTLPFADATGEKERALAARYKAQFGKDVPYSLYYVGASYDATNMIADALRACGQDTKCVAGKFKVMNYQGSVGQYAFKENGDLQAARWARGVIGEDGKFKLESIQ